MERVEPSAGKPPLQRPVDPRGRSNAPRSSIVWPAAMIAAVVVAGWLVWRQMHPQPPQASSPAAPSVPQSATPVATGPAHPIEAAGAGAPLQPPARPALADSDPALQDAMAAIFGKAPLDRIFHLQQIVQRFVATIDNLPRQTAAVQRMPVQPVGGSLLTARADGQTVVASDNAVRYAPYVSVMEAADTGRLVATYVRFYPLFQKAYEDLGYPGKYFNDRLVYVIDDLLAAPEPAGPIALVQPKIIYKFADPQLESLSAGQKIMVRMGHDNELRVKAKLRAIRQALVGNPPPRQEPPR
ncbi:MAG: DUF3014 domain-containing protein [Betaproteobacteria bacterium]|nr:DUF3014 domain-containing protein [Betaproteobacteria bacterium]